MDLAVGDGGGRGSNQEEPLEKGAHLAENVLLAAQSCDGHKYQGQTFPRAVALLFVICRLLGRIFSLS